MVGKLLEKKSEGRHKSAFRETQVNEGQLVWIYSGKVMTD